MTAGIGWDSSIDSVEQVAGSSTRGVILHKLMEELLTGELEASSVRLQQRAAGLVRQLASGRRPEPEIDARDLAATALRTMALPELAGDRVGLMGRSRFTDESVRTTLAS